jgi:hypothetical protein
LQQTRPPDGAQVWPAHDPSRETPSEALAKEGAEGATTPETLRQKDRDRVMNFWKVKQQLLFPPKG